MDNAPLKNKPILQFKQSKETIDPTVPAEGTVPLPHVLISWLSKLQVPIPNPVQPQVFASLQQQEQLFRRHKWLHWERRDQKTPGHRQEPDL